MSLLSTPVSTVIHIHSSNYDDVTSGEVHAIIARIMRSNDCKGELVENDGHPHHRLFPTTEHKLKTVCTSLRSNAINYALMTPAK